MEALDPAWLRRLVSLMCRSASIGRMNYPMTISFVAEARNQGGSWLGQQCLMATIPLTGRDEAAV